MIQQEQRWKAPEENRAPPAKGQKIQSDISSFVFNDKPSLDEETSGLLADDGLSFRVVSASTRIRMGFKALGHDVLYKVAFVELGTFEIHNMHLYVVSIGMKLGIEESQYKSYNGRNGKIFNGHTFKSLKKKLSL